MANETKIDEVVEELYQRISQGIYSAGERLPAERDLAQEMHVSRQTVHSAMLRLQTENQIDIRPRDGAFVRTPSAKVLIGPMAPIARGKSYVGLFTNAIQKQQHEIESRFIEPSEVIPAGQDLARKMEVEVGTELLRTYQMYLVNQVPYRTIESYFLAAFMRYMGVQSIIDEPPLQDKPTQSRILTHGSEVKIQSSTHQPGKDEGFDHPEFELTFDAKQTASPYAFERFNCRLPSPKEAEFLHMGRNQPVIDIERWTWLSNHMLLEYEHIVANALLHEYTYAYAERDNMEDLSLKRSVGS